MVRIVVFTDTHANLPALQAFRKAAEQDGYDHAFHTGDAIDIGPYPAECLDVLLDLPRTEFVMGNHDAIYVDGVPDPLPCFMETNELEHCRWTAAELGETYREPLSQWPYHLTRTFEEVSVTFVHYGLTDSLDGFVATGKKEPTAADLDSVFAPFDAQLLFYGHHHPFSDLQGKARYINPGSLGCFYRPLARYCVLDIDCDRCRITYKAVPYDDSELIREFDRRQVPARQFILKEFYGKNID